MVLLRISLDEDGQRRKQTGARLVPGSRRVYAGTGGYEAVAG